MPSLPAGPAYLALVAEAQVDAADDALRDLDALLEQGGPPARRFQPARATRAHLLDRLGRSEEAVAAYDGAIDLTHDTAERQYLQHRRDAVSRPSPRVKGAARRRVADC